MPENPYPSKIQPLSPERIALLERLGARVTPPPTEAFIKHLIHKKRYLNSGRKRYLESERAKQAKDAHEHRTEQNQTPKAPDQMPMLQRSARPRNAMPAMSGYRSRA